MLPRPDMYRACFYTDVKSEDGNIPCTRSVAVTQYHFRILGFSSSCAVPLIGSHILGPTLLSNHRASRRNTRVNSSRNSPLQGQASFAFYIAYASAELNVAVSSKGPKSVVIASR